MSYNGKRKWEIEYENLKTKGVDQEIKKLNTKIKRLSGKEITGTNPQEYRKSKIETENQINETKKEVARLGRIKENLPKVERTVNFRDAQIKRLEKLTQDKKTYEASLQETKKLSDEAEKLEEELAELKEQEQKINEALKDPNRSDENRKNLEIVKKQNAQARSLNNDRFSKIQKDLEEKLKNPLPKRDFDKEIQVAKNMISKSNFICRNLMAGKKMEEISVDLNNWKDGKFTDKSNGTKNKVENSQEESEKSKTKKIEKTEKEDLFEEIDQAVQRQIQENGENKPAKVSEFDQKHPRLAKIKNFFKNAYTTVVGKFSNLRKKEDKSGKADKKEPEGKMSSEEISGKKAEFYKRLAETGKFSQMPDNSKLADSMKQIDETKREIDEGR